MILIPEPQGFFCEPDEDHFFSWLKEIPAIKEVRGRSDGLELELKEPIDRTSFYELAGLLARYSLPMRCLRPLCENHSDPWFNDHSNYWYKHVFETDAVH